MEVIPSSTSSNVFWLGVIKLAGGPTRPYRVQNAVAVYRLRRLTDNQLAQADLIDLNDLNPLSLPLSFHITFVIK